MPRKYYTDCSYRLLDKSVTDCQRDNYYSYFTKKIDELKKFNLDEDTFFIEFNDKILNG